MKKIGFVALGLLAIVVPMGACGSPLKETCDERGACTTSSTADGGLDAPLGDGGDGADVEQPPADCVLTKEPKDSPACIADSVGVFVDATNGLDTNPGKRDAPVKTITTAIGKLAGKSRIYVCEGTYVEHVKLTSAVSIYGGFACVAWTYKSDARVKVAPTDPGYALEVAKVADAVQIADVSFAAMPGNDAAPSSIAAFVNASPNLSLRRVEFVAGAGLKGKDASKGATLALMTSAPTAGTLNGNGATGNVGGSAQLCTCAGGNTSMGGGGGNLNADGSPGETAPAMVDPAGATGAGGTKAECVAPGTNGRPGSNAPSPAAVAAGAGKLGTLSEAGWGPEGGKDGTAGAAGQGGGGGGGAGGGGGGGACGGCGGEGGKGGGGGGASIALVTVNSPITLAACTLTTTDAGAGGAGGTGGDGLAGGTGGTRGGGACNGGNGGKGGSGGGGGGGAGGISAGVLYKGAKPNVDATIKTGAKGAPGSGPAGNDGVDGVKSDVPLEAPAP